MPAPKKARRGRRTTRQKGTAAPEALRDAYSTRTIEVNGTTAPAGDSDKYGDGIVVRWQRDETAGDEHEPQLFVGGAFTCTDRSANGAWLTPATPEHIRGLAAVLNILADRVEYANGPGTIITRPSVN